MKARQLVIDNTSSLNKLTEFTNDSCDLCLLFGGPTFFQDEEAKKYFSQSKGSFIGCSTAGEIFNDGVNENSLVATAIQFEKGSSIKSASSELNQPQNSFDAGKELGSKLKGPDLRLVFVLGNGVNVNGSELIRGIEHSLGGQVTVTGGLAGDNGEFKATYTLLNGNVSGSSAVAVGFYGDQLKIGCGTQGGWKPFGPVRKVTKVEGNVLYELDGESALSVYETYLGDKAKELPASGLLYPFAIIEGEKEETGLIRTILGIDKDKGSLTLAGDVPDGGFLRLMHTGSDGLVAGAEGAAEQTKTASHSDELAGLAILVSCVGRKIVMGQDTDEEVEVVKDVLPQGTTLTGFYSYGEIGPFEKANCSMLHNQTMTITFLAE